MRKFNGWAWGLFALLVGLHVFRANDCLAAQRVALSDVAKNPDKYTDTLVQVEGFCEVWSTDKGPDVNFYMLKDNYGNVLKVRSLKANPPLGRVLLVEGLMIADAQRRSFYLDERSRHEVGGLSGPTYSPWLITGILIGSLAFIVLAVLILKNLKSQPEARPVQPPPRQPSLMPVPAAGPPPVANVERTQKVRGKRIGYEIPIDTTFKVLPGKFVIVKGDAEVSEIKLYQVTAEPVFTFGRKPGPAMRHIQVDDPTVSGKQAQLVYRDGKFTMTNYSTTNPTIVDGAELGEGESREIKDGMLVIMGEVTMRFEARRMASGS